MSSSSEDQDTDESLEKPILTPGWAGVDFVGTEPETIITNFDRNVVKLGYNHVKLHPSDTIAILREKEIKKANSKAIKSAPKKATKVPMKAPAKTLVKLSQNSTRPPKPIAYSEDEEEEDASEVAELPVQVSNGTLQEVQNVNNVPMNEQEFWNYIGTLNWRDKCDGKMMIKELPFIRQIGKVRLNSFWDLVNSKITQLKTTLADIAEEYDLEVDSNEFQAIASHIVAKGSTFYNAVIGTPSLAQYIVEGSEEQNLYMLKN